MLEQRLELGQLVEWVEVGVLRNVVEVGVAGGDRLVQAGQRAVDVLLTLGLFGLGPLVSAFSEDELAMLSLAKRRVRRRPSHPMPLGGQLE